jgi:hypothetical protein
MMRVKNKKVSDANIIMEGSAFHKGNIVKDVKVLGIYSKNGRVYPLEVMQKALPKYEGIVVNLDHKPNDPRSVMDRFGQIENVYMGQDGIYGDLVYNPEHPYAKAFEYFVNNQPTALGLSHAAIARTKMDRGGNETVEDIVELESVDLVAVPATNKNLFESYTQIMESLMRKEKTEPSKVVEAELVMPGKKVYVPEEDKMEETMQDGNLPHKSWGESVDKVKSGKYESYEDYCKDMKEAVNAIMGADLSHEDKLENIMGLMAPKEKHESKEDDDKKEESKAPMIFDESKDCDDKVKAEESIRKSNVIGMKLLLEELDAFRIKEKHERNVAKVKEFCSNSGLNERLLTEAFIDVLVSVNESKWATLVNDRKSIAVNTKSPISFAGDVASGHKALTVDELVKKLRS